MAKFQNPLTYPRERLRELCIEIMQAYPNLTFTTRDLARLVDNQVRDEDPRPVAIHSVQTIVRTLRAYSRPLDPSRDVMLSKHTRTNQQMLYSMTNPVPEYTQDMVGLFTAGPELRDEPDYNPIYPNGLGAYFQDGNEQARRDLFAEITAAAERGESLDRYSQPDPIDELDKVIIAEISQATAPTPAPATTRGEMLIELVKSYVHDTEQPEEDPRIAELERENGILREHLKDARKQLNRIRRAIAD